MKQIEVNSLWYGDHFICNGSVYCLIRFNPQDRTIEAIKAIYDEPRAYGNIMVSFDYGDKVVFLPRAELSKYYSQES